MGARQKGDALVLGVAAEAEVETARTLVVGCLTRRDREAEGCAVTACEIRGKLALVSRPASDSKPNALPREMVKEDRVEVGDIGALASIVDARADLLGGRFDFESVGGRRCQRERSKRRKGPIDQGPALSALPSLETLSSESIS